MTSTLLTGIAELVTNDPAAGPGLLGTVHDAAVLIEGSRVAWVGHAAAAPGPDGYPARTPHPVPPGCHDAGPRRAARPPRGQRRK